MSTNGRKANQKMKPYLVYQYLLRETDEAHVIGAAAICEYLQSLGIDAERRSIYKDIEAINDMLWLLDNKDNYDFDEGLDYVIEQAKEDGDYFEVILYDSHKKGFYVSERKYLASDIRLIAECIYSSRYISQYDAERLVNIVKEFISNKEAEDIKTDALVTNRVKTINKSTLTNVSTIYDAMSSYIHGEPHKPEKISFKYLKYDISNLDQQIERNQGKVHVVSPFKLIINDGNYYLLAFSDDNQDMRTYRIDRMKSIKRLGVPRDGKSEFNKIDLRTYTQRVFSMYGGEKERVTMRFRMGLLDTAVERFGRKDTRYLKLDDYHFQLEADVEISNQFYGWLCGLGTGVQILAPHKVVVGFSDYMEEILKRYK